MVCTTRAAYRRRARERRANRIKELRKVESFADNFFLVKIQSKMSNTGRGKEKAVEEDYGLWSPHITEYFVNLMEAAVDNGYLKSNTFEAKTWSNFAQQMNLVCGRAFSVPQLKSKYGRLKSEWKVFADMRKQSGFGWDEANETVTCEAPVWEQYVKMHPAAKKYQYKGLPHFDALTKIMEESVAQGNVARASTQRGFQDEEARRMNYEFGHSHQSHVNVIDEADDVPMGTGSGSRKRKSSASSGRGTAMSMMKEYLDVCKQTQEVKRSRYKNKNEVDSSPSINPALAEQDQCQDIIDSMTGLDPIVALKAGHYLFQNPNICHAFLRMSRERQELALHFYATL